MKVALWSARFFKFFYFTHHSHWQGLRANQIALFQECVVHPVFIFCLFFRKWGQKLWSAQFWWVINKLEKPGGPLSCLIWQISYLLWSFSNRCCDPRAVHPHTIIPSFVFLSFSTGLSRKAIKGKFYPNISSISSSK